MSLVRYIDTYNIGIHNAVIRFSLLIAVNPDDVALGVVGSGPLKSKQFSPGSIRADALRRIADRARVNPEAALGVRVSLVSAFSFGREG